MGNLRNESNYVKSFWDWSKYNNCFEHGIRLTDVDGLVERNSHILIVETKGPGQDLVLGQALAFKRLKNLNPEHISIVALRGEPDDPREVKVLTSKGWPRKWQPTTPEEEIRKVARWYQRVDTAPKYRPTTSISIDDATSAVNTLMNYYTKEELLEAIYQSQDKLTEIEQLETIGQ